MPRGRAAGRLAADSSEASRALWPSGSPAGPRPGHRIAAMYTDPEEARSDLLLAAAVYLFGPLLLEAVTGLYRVAVVGSLLRIVAPLLTTALVPVLMARYRKEPGTHYGLTGERASGLRSGALLAVPLIVAVAVIFALSGGILPGTLPALARGGAPLGRAVDLLANAAGWLGLTVLAVYATVKARDAFRSDLRSVREGVLEVGRALAIAGGVAGLLLLATVRDPAAVLLPLGAAGGVYLLLRGLRGPSTTSRAALVAPVVLLALRPFNLIALFGDRTTFVASVWSAAILGAVGLMAAASLESRRASWAAAGLACALALFVPVQVAS